MRREHQLWTRQPRPAAILLTILWALLCGVSALKDNRANVKADQKQHFDRIIDWIQELGGSFHEHQEYRRSGDYHYRVFATQDIPQGTVLLEVPPQAVINGRLLWGDDHEGKESPSGALSCNLIEYLLGELEWKEDGHFKSFFAPYLQHILDATSTIPTFWSKNGQDLLVSILGHNNPRIRQNYRLPPVEPIHWYEADYKQGCPPKHEDDRDSIPEAQEKAIIEWVVSHGRDDYLFPGADFYLHGQANAHSVKSAAIVTASTTTTTANNEPPIFQMVATRDIAMGEEILQSYNLCPDCGFRRDSYGTPEIFRDHGFVEQYPQWWIFHDMELLFQVSESHPTTTTTTTTSQYQVQWLAADTESKGLVVAARRPDRKTIQVLVDNFYRLNRLALFDLLPGRETWAATDGNDLIPEHEWSSCVEFLNAAIAALKHAIEDVRGEAIECQKIDDNDDHCIYAGLYHPEIQPHGFRKNVQTCDVDKLLKLDGYIIMDNFKTAYQQICFLQQQDAQQSVCMDLEDTVQICDSYRPHYHEYSVHYAARYVKSMKRVMFIGGGDSMILHEVLKYPDLELVVGLELDQSVTRSSFKWFRTQPHFDDDRVEWWFGDATKSLLLLPKEWANSFDLILVDLSETVASMTVTNHLDVLEALSLLLKPDGVMLKNEMYFEKMSTAFDYALEFHFYDCPVICDQTMILGSNGIDFFHQELTDHNLTGDTLLLPSIEDYPDKFYLVHDYRINNATEQGKCQTLKNAMDDASSTGSSALYEDDTNAKSKGMLLILDIERCSMPLAEFMASIEAAARELGFSVHKKDGDTSSAINFAMLFLEEGYAAVRHWPDEDYYGVDLYLWTHFNQMNAFKAAILKELQPSGDILSSSFRIIVSGIRGISSWKEVSQQYGPDISKHTRNCPLDDSEVPTVAANDGISAALIRKVFIEETFEVIYGNIDEHHLSIIVFCGSENEVCESKMVLEEMDTIQTVIPLYDDKCAHTGGTNGALHQLGDAERGLFRCEQHFHKVLDAALGRSKVGGAILDVAASESMGKVFRSFNSNQRSVTNRFDDQYILLVAKDEYQEDAWQETLLSRQLMQLKLDPIFHVNMAAHDEASSPRKKYSLEFMVIGNERAMDQAYLIESKINGKLSSVSVSVQSVKGGMYQYQDETYNPHLFAPDSYDSDESMNQFDRQMPMGRQSVIQLERTSPLPAVASEIEALFLSTIAEVYTSARPASKPRIATIGNGKIVIAEHATGNSILIWDGGKHITTTLFSRKQSKKIADSFLETFLNKSNNEWKRELRDDMPRGTDQVINFESDWGVVDDDDDSGASVPPNDSTNNDDMKGEL